MGMEASRTTGCGAPTLFQVALEGNTKPLHGTEGTLPLRGGRRESVLLFRSRVTLPE